LTTVSPGRKIAVLADRAGRNPARGRVGAGAMLCGKVPSFPKFSQVFRGRVMIISR